MSDHTNLTITIPTLNEASNIAELIDLITELYPNASIIVSDDGSKDGTQEIVQEYNQKNSKIKLLDRRNASEHGLTASVVDAVLTVETEYFVNIDGDLQHPPELIKDLYKLLVDGAEIVSGKRNPYKENQGLHRIIVTRTATSLAKIFLFFKGHKIGDPMSGFFGGQTKLIQDIIQDNKNRFELGGYKVLFDIMKSTPKGIRFAEEMYQFRFRTGGESKLQAKHAWFFLRGLWK